MKKLPVFVASLFVLFAIGCTSKKKQARYLDYKSFKDNYAKVSDSLYAGVGEVSNGQYTIFINSLRESGQNDLAKRYNFDSAQWRSVLTYSEPLVMYYHGHPAYKDYPAVNISYEGAEAYCKWLTDEYQKNPKRKFKKAIFRLPTEAEWKQAARGGREGFVFPWGGPYLRNSKGEYLANFKRIEEGSAKDTVINGRKVVLIDNQAIENIAGSLNDNGMVTIPIKSYWPNSFGLYNMAGNVSEMLAQQGHAKGGNWNSYGYYLRIDAEDEFAGKQLNPSPLVGFRVFVEVVEK
jgi:formylglycine-generating enzyme